MNDLKNAEYQSSFPARRRVKLTNGIYREKIVPNSATDLIIILSDKVAYGDLNGDGEEDAAVILITDSGGSGTFHQLAVVLNQKGSPNHVASQLLGDRVEVKSLSVRSGEIAVEMITHGPNDPLCCPTLEVTQNYLLQGDKLADSQAPKLTDRKWTLQSFGTIGSEERPLPETEMSIEFTADGRLHGSGGCNRYFSTYETESDGSLTIKQIGSTRMACPPAIMDQEMKYFRSLQGVSTFKVTQQHLQLFYGNGDQVLNYMLSP
jgi:heat shock protein HslJ